MWDIIVNQVSYIFSSLWSGIRSSSLHIINHCSIFSDWWRSRLLYKSLIRVSMF